MNVYSGSNDVSQQISKKKTEIYLRIFDVFTFWWGIAPSWQHLAVDFCYPSLVELYYSLMIPLDKEALKKKTFVTLSRIWPLRGAGGGGEGRQGARGGVNLLKKICGENLFYR